MANQYLLSSEDLSIKQLESLIRSGDRIQLSDELNERIQICRQYLDDKLANSDQAIYGINTGFGSLCDVKIDHAQLEQLQHNLVISHACGTGDRVPDEIVKLMLLLKIRSLSFGHSGVQLSTVQRLIDLYNNECYPEVFEQGSLGASGDLAPLAHLALPLLGFGNVSHKGQLQKAEEVNRKLNWDALHLQSKEGLALLNGTQFMSAYGVQSLIEAKQLSTWTDKIAAISLEAFDCKTEPFEHFIHDVRPHPGQQKTASFLMDLLSGSEIASQSKEQVQDPYSFRCIPQVHGASKQVIDHVESVFTTEINSVTDNPNIFPEDDRIISGGNFHGQPLALALDYLAIGLAELASISERRTYLLLSGQRGLPEFLVKNSGLNSGFMIPQYTAASIVSQNKQLCTPSSVDSVPSSNGQEDHVSMGANGATKCFKVVQNLRTVLAIELFTACQALEFRRPKRSSQKIEEIFESFRKHIPFIEEDVLMHDMILKATKFLK